MTVRPCRSGHFRDSHQTPTPGTSIGPALFVTLAPAIHQQAAPVPIAESVVSEETELWRGVQRTIMASSGHEEAGEEAGAGEAGVGEEEGGAGGPEGRPAAGGNGAPGGNSGRASGSRALGATARGGSGGASGGGPRGTTTGGGRDAGYSDDSDSDPEPDLGCKEVWNS